MVKYSKTICNTQELEDLGWLKRPSAKEYYLNNPTLQAQYSTYDKYVTSCYEKSHHEWNSGGTASQEQTKVSKPRGILSTEPQTTEEIEDKIFRKAMKSSILEEKKTKRYEHYEFINNSGDEVKIKKFKSKVKKPKNNYRQRNTTCPYCLSTLKLNLVKTWECTGDRLKLWETEFLKYNQLPQEDKNKYLLNFSYPSLFIDLYDKWNYLEDGRRVRFLCEYTNQIFNPISRFRTTIPDPILVKRIERSLGKKLTDEEKLGEIELYREGRTFFKDFKRGRVKVKIPQVTYPDGFMV